MRLNTINTDYNYNYNKNTSFNGIEHFDYIKKLDGMVCAVCKKKTLPSDVFIRANIPNCKPLIYNMEKKFLDYIKDSFPRVWGLLIKFSEEFPNESLDNIMENSENYIALKQTISSELKENNNDALIAKEKTVVDRIIGRTFFNLLEASRTDLAPASITLKNLAKVKSFLTDEPLKAFELLEKYSQKYPQKTLSEIVNTEEVYTYHTRQDQINRKKLYDKVYFHLENINSLVEKEDPQVIEDFFYKKNEAIKILRETYDPKERMYKIKELYRLSLIKHNCEHLTEKIYKEIEAFPTTFMTADTFLAYAHKHNLPDGKIITQIFSPIFTTEEHLDTVAEGGGDEIKNKLVMHKNCNQMRNRTPYSQFILYHPDFQQNVQYQMNLITDALLKEKIPSFLDFYPLKMPPELAAKSNGAIEIDIIKYCIEGIKLSQKRESVLTEKLQSVTALRDKKIFEKMKIKGAEPKLDAELKFLHCEILRIKESIKIEGKKRYRMENYLASKGVQ